MIAEDVDYTKRCLDGKELFGNDFNEDEILTWFKLESQAYANLHDSYGLEDKAYQYHQLNIIHAFKNLPVLSNHSSDRPRYQRVLSFGGAYGDELLPIINDVNEIFILEPGDSFKNHHLGDKKVTYISPEVSGHMPFPDNHFDLIVCFSALHHVPNVGAILNEFSRTLNSGGSIIIREPTSSMGDWRVPRPGTTSCERGISVKMMISLLPAELHVTHLSMCDFPVVRRLANMLGIEPFNNKLIVYIDAVFSRIFNFNSMYYPKNFFQKLKPGAATYILQKAQ